MRDFTFNYLLSGLRCKYKIVLFIRLIETQGTFNFDYILDFSESGLGQIPPNTSCTERPQQWHKPTQRTSNVPVLFKDILMIKHDYDADKRKKTEKRTERKNEKEAYSSCPSFALQVTRKQIKESNAVILNVLQGNDWQPVTVKTIEDKLAKHTVLVDHDYLPGKHKRNETQTGIEASKCELDHLFKKAPVHCFGENQCEPLDINVLPELIISHSVAISNLPEQQTETSMIVETETDEAMISEETLNDDPDFQSNSNFTIPDPTQCYPDDLDLTDENFIALCKEYMKTIKITEDGINTVEEKTRGQSSNSDWFQYRCGRLTASKFGEISNRRVTTPPDRLVRDVFQYNCRPNIPYQCQVGLEMEPVIIGKYFQHQKNKGQKDKDKGLVIDKDNPVLALSVDGEVSDSTNKYHPIGSLEAKKQVIPIKVKGTSGYKANFIT